MADVTGPTSSLPGQSQSAPEGTMCDLHPDRKAEHAVTGETDSFGSEVIHACSECFRVITQEKQEQYEAESFCDWCRTSKKFCKPHRDFEEGRCGRVYNVCKDCRREESKAIRRELDDYRY